MDFMGHGNFAFDDLDLSGVDAGEASIAPMGIGRHHAVIEHAKMIKSANGKSSMLVIRFVSLDGQSQTFDRITLHHKSSPQAQDIGRRRMKLLLQCAGHPNPDRPGRVESIEGLTVGVDVGPGDLYTDKTTGRAMEGNPKPREYSPYFAITSDTPPPIPTAALTRPLVTAYDNDDEPAPF
jgi:hypothetical protein